MAAEAWLTQGAAALWERTGGPPPFPRSLDHLRLYGLQAQLLSIPRLTLAVVVEHRRKWNLPEIPSEPERHLRGCLVMRHGRAVIFLDADDPEPERRLTLAHEIAHLWLEVMEPRDRVQEHLGEQALEVLDGMRHPRRGERLQATLHRVPLRRPFHLLERDPEHGVLREDVRIAEERANRLALELLAPEEAAILRLPLSRAPFLEWLEQAGATLAAEFGLPLHHALSYARRLAPAVGARPSFWERLSG